VPVQHAVKFCMSTGCHFGAKLFY